MLALGAIASGCTDEPELSETESAATVSSYIYGGCSTAAVIGLSKQIAQQVGCDHPTNGLVAFQAGGNLVITSNAVLPYLEKDAKADLLAVAQSHTVQVNSAFRTIAQQYLLYNWYTRGLCGITAAATVGTSNHESGRAVDLANYSALVSAMSARGWAHDVPGDDVHFDHLASSDIRGEDVKAFQELWNRNHPTDLLAVDGSYGPATEARLKAAPATGFAMGASCTDPAQTFDADVLSVDGPDRAPPQTKVHYAITVKNTGNVTWPATTTLQLASGTSSVLHDDSWTSATVVTTLGASVAAGKQATIDFDVTTPAADAETPVMEGLTLADGGTTFGTISLALTVVPGMTQPTSGDGSDQNDGAAGGCNAGGRSGGLGLLLALAIVMARRRSPR